MTVIHVVSFKFKPRMEPEQVKELADRMYALKATCLHPTTEQPYIISAAGGRDNSVQGLQNGFTHVFVVGFANQEDRDYYALRDPVHLEFVQWSENVVDEVFAIDFVDREFHGYGI